MDKESFNLIDTPANNLKSESEAKYQVVNYGTDEKGRPTYTAGYQSTINYSDPIGYEVDYIQMSMISVFQGYYDHNREHDARIVAINTGIMAIQTAIGIAAGFKGGSLSKSPGLKALHGGALCKKFVGEMFEEMVTENVVSGGLKFLGFSEGIADNLGEAAFSGLFSSDIQADGQKEKGYKSRYNKAKELIHESNTNQDLGTATQNNEGRSKSQDSNGKSSFMKKIWQKQIAIRMAMTMNMETMTDFANNLQKQGKAISNMDLNQLSEMIDAFDNLISLKAEDFDLKAEEHDIVAATFKNLVIQYSIAQGVSIQEFIDSPAFHEKFKVVNGRTMYLKLQHKKGDAKSETLAQFNSIEIRDAELAANDKDNTGRIKYELVDGEIGYASNIESFMAEFKINSEMELIAGFGQLTLIDPLVDNNIEFDKFLQKIDDHDSESVSDEKTDEFNSQLPDGLKIPYGLSTKLYDRLWKGYGCQKNVQGMMFELFKTEAKLHPESLITLRKNFNDQMCKFLTIDKLRNYKMLSLCNLISSDLDTGKYVVENAFTVSQQFSKQYGFDNLKGKKLAIDDVLYEYANLELADTDTGKVISELSDFEWNDIYNKDHKSKEKYCGESNILNKVHRDIEAGVYSKDQQIYLNLFVECEICVDCLSKVADFLSMHDNVHIQVAWIWSGTKRKDKFFRNLAENPQLEYEFSVNYFQVNTLQQLKTTIETNPRNIFKNENNLYVFPQLLNYIQEIEGRSSTQ